LVPGDEKYAPQGYKICDLGPKEMVGKGGVEIDKMRGEMRLRMGCAG
jgi:hypothetical protein